MEIYLGMGYLQMMKRKCHQFCVHTEADTKLYESLKLKFMKYIWQPFLKVMRVMTSLHKKQYLSNFQWNQQVRQESKTVLREACMFW